MSDTVKEYRELWSEAILADAVKEYRQLWVEVLFVTEEDLKSLEARRRGSNECHKTKSLKSRRNLSTSKKTGPLSLGKWPCIFLFVSFSVKKTEPKQSDM